MLPALFAILANHPFERVPIHQEKKPWKPPVEAIEKRSDYSGLWKELGDGDSRIFAKGQTLTYLARGDESPLSLPDWFKPAASRGSDGLWVAQAKVEHGDRAFFTYRINEKGKSVGRTFFAPHAPKLREATGPLKGRVETIAFPSKTLGESRNITIYLPPNPLPGLSAVYMADGQSCEAFARVLEPLILAHAVAPTAIIGLHHGEYKGEVKPDFSDYDVLKDFRAREYLKVADPERFALHLKFLTDEVIPWAERKYGVAAGASHRALFGYSNGGAFAMVASVDRPDVFSAILPFSIAAFDREALGKSAEGKRLPRYWMTAGTLEPFIQATGEANRILKLKHARVRFDTYVSGHDEALWKVGFAQTMPKVFPHQS